jgi:hypothetical protein
MAGTPYWHIEQRQPHRNVERRMKVMRRQVLFSRARRLACNAYSGTEDCLKKRIFGIKSV